MMIRDAVSGSRQEKHWYWGRLEGSTEGQTPRCQVTLLAELCSHLLAMLFIASEELD